MPKFRIGRPPRHQLDIITGWKSIKTFDQRRLLFSLCIGTVIGLFMALLWRTNFDNSIPFGSPTWIEILLVLATLTIAHEALHLLGFPSFGLNSKTVVGVWPEAGSPYVQYMSPMSRNRFLIVSALPFLVLSILPFAAALSEVGPIAQLSWISVLNCIGAGSDIFVFIQVLRSVPSKASVIESEESLYWQG